MQLTIETAAVTTTIDLAACARADARRHRARRLAAEVSARREAAVVLWDEGPLPPMRPLLATHINGMSLREARALGLA